MLARRASSRLIFQIAALCALVGCSKHQAEILPSSEMRDKYQLTAENRPSLTLDRSKLPSDLVDLAPYAEKWGIADDVIREDFQSKASPAEKQALAAALKGRNKRITEWLDSQPQGEQMSTEASAFMYMQLGSDEMELWED